MNTSDLFKNYTLDTDSYDYQYTETNNMQYGGTENDIPNGGFPPIYICEVKRKEETLKDDDEKTKREYTTHKTAVSIKSILEKRRKNTPFIKV